MSLTSITVLTCCARHTSHSEGLLSQDIHYRLSTDHRPPLALWTTGEKQKQELTITVATTPQIIDIITL